MSIPATLQPSAGLDIAADADGAIVARSPTALFWRRLRQDKVAVASLVVVVVLIVVAIAATIQRQFGIATTVSCPAHPPEQSGYRFACIARLAVGAYAVTVLETNSHGRVSYTGSGPLRALDIVSVEHAIAAAMGHGRRAPASVHCPSPVLQRSGLAFTCTARTRGGAVVRFTVSQDNGNGRVTLTSA